MTNELTTPNAASALQVMEAPPLDRNPAAVYLTGLKSERSRRVMIDALNHGADVLKVEKVLADDTTSKRRKQANVTYLFVRWADLRFQHTRAIQNKLLETYSAASVNRMMSAVNGVLKACWRLELMSIEDYNRAIDYSPAKGDTLPAGRDIAQGELIALADVCKMENSPAGSRDAAIIGILYTCGLRRSELVALEMADYDAENSKLKILHGKGNKQRIVYVKNGAARALAAWLECRGTEPGALFMPVNKGGKIDPSAMTDQAVYNMLKKRAEQAGLSKFSPHDFRRTFVGDLLDRGADIVTVQHLAGHASVTTTGRYDRRPEKVKEDAASKLHFPF
jgi:site-specific recombinase XerD